MVEYKSWENRIFDAVVLFILLLLTVICLLPLLNVVALSFSDKQAALAGEVGLWPVNFTWSSYEYLVADSRFFASFWVSTKRVLLGGSLNLILTLLMAFPLSLEKKEFPSRNRYMWLVVFTMLFNAGLVPWYFVIKYTGIMNSIWALVLPGAVPVFNVILLMNFFKGVPKSLEEAAAIDGASKLTILLKIYLPISMPALATIILFCIVNHWNDFFSGLVYMNKTSMYPLQTYIQQLSVDMSQITDPEQLKRFAQVSNKTLDAAKIVVSTIPLLIIYPFLQKYFVSGIVIGAVKE